MNDYVFEVIIGLAFLQLSSTWSTHFINISNHPVYLSFFRGLHPTPFEKHERAGRRKLNDHSTEFENVSSFVCLQYQVWSIMKHTDGSLHFLLTNILLDSPSLNLI